MIKNHLSDETLQAFLLKDTNDNHVVEHLSVCEVCRMKLLNYQHLVIGIEKMRSESFDFDVTSLVMDRVIQYEKQKRSHPKLVFWLLLAILLIVISSFSIPFIHSIITLFNSLPLITTLLIMGTGTVVLVVLLADIYRQYKMNEKKYLKNNLQPIV